MAGAAAGAGLSLIGGVLGQNASAGDMGQARNQAIIANGILQQIQQAPDISKPLILQQYRQAGILTPQMEQYINAGTSQAANITTDPALKSAQMQALQQLQQRSTQGLTATDRAALNQARLATEGDTQAKIAQIQQQAAMRGQAGGGTELAAALSAAQGGANTESTAADQIAAQAQQAALQSALQSGQLGGQIQAQQFGQQFQQAQAADQMQRFNVQNQIAQQQRNVGAANQAQYSNLANLQQAQNLNTQQANSEAYNQLQRQMQQYGANLNRAQIQAGGAAQLGNAYKNFGQQAAQGVYNTFGGLGQMASGGINALNSPGPAKYNTQTGASLYNPQTGVSYADEAALGAWNGGKINDYRQGGEVPGQAKMPGDHPSNDTVHAMLSPQEIVVPRSLAESKIGKEILKLVHAHNSVKNKLNEKD